MTRFYLRWSALVVVAVIIAFLASRYFDRHLASLAPEDIVSRQPVAVVRVRSEERRVGKECRL